LNIWIFTTKNKRKIMEKPVISLFGASIRPHLCLHAYESVKQATVLPFELIFCGPAAPTFVLPENLRYIKTENIKPIQCWQIAVMQTSGEVISIVADDLIYTPHAWDEAYALYQSKQNYKAMVSLRTFYGGIDQSYTTRFPGRGSDVGGRRNVLLPTGITLMSKRFFLELGGFDRSFIQCDANYDFFARAYCAGAEFLWSETARTYEDVEWARGTHGTCSGGWTTLDWARMEHLWYPGGGGLLEARSEPFDPYVMDDSITKVSQGATHPRWV
jgi:hypothetical protein